MKEFVMDLYANENFPLYLGIVIAVLLVAFLIVFFLGKKDKKKTNKENTVQGFNETTVATPVEVPQTFVNPAVPPVNELVKDEPVVAAVQSEIAAAPVLENPTPNINIEQSYVSTPVVEQAPVAPVMPVVTPETSPTIEPNVSAQIPIAEPMTASVVEPIAPVTPTPIVEPITAPIPEPAVETLPPVQEPVTNPQPIVAEQTPAVESPVEVISTVPLQAERTYEYPTYNNDIYESPVIDEKTVVLPIINEEKIESNVDKFNELASQIDKELTALENTLKNREPLNPNTKIINTFSPVFAPQKEENEFDTMEIELPKLKSASPVLEEQKEDNIIIK